MVSKSILGDINRPPAPLMEEEEPPDPNCFTNDIPFEYNNISLDKNGVRKGVLSSCCHQPSPLEIDMDWELYSEGLDWNIQTTDDYLPNCCDD